MKAEREKSTGRREEERRDSCHRGRREAPREQGSHNMLKGKRERSKEWKRT